MDPRVGGSKGFCTGSIDTGSLRVSPEYSQLEKTRVLTGLSFRLFSEILPSRTEGAQELRVCIFRGVPAQPPHAQQLSLLPLPQVSGRRHVQAGLVQLS